MTPLMLRSGDDVTKLRSWNLTLQNHSNGLLRHAAPLLTKLKTAFQNHQIPNK